MQADKTNVNLVMHNVFVDLQQATEIAKNPTFAKNPNEKSIALVKTDIALAAGQLYGVENQLERVGAPRGSIGGLASTISFIGETYFPPSSFTTNMDSPATEAAVQWLSQLTNDLSTIAPDYTENINTLLGESMKQYKSYVNVPSWNSVYSW